MCKSSGCFEQVDRAHIITNSVLTNLYLFVQISSMICNLIRYNK